MTYNVFGGTLNITQLNSPLSWLSCARQSHKVILSSMIYCSNIKHRHNGVSVSQPDSKVCTYRGRLYSCCPAAAWQWRAGWEGSDLVNAGATGVSHCSQLNKDCGQVLIHSWQHVSAWVACMAMSMSDRTLDMLLDQLPDLDLPTILARMAPRGPGQPLFPLVHSLTGLLLFFTFPFSQWL